MRPQIAVIMAYALLCFILAGSRFRKATFNIPSPRHLYWAMRGCYCLRHRAVKVQWCNKWRCAACNSEHYKAMHRRAEERNERRMNALERLDQ